MKKFTLKRKLKKGLSFGLRALSTEKIKTVGLLIDETHFADKNQLIQALEAKGIESQDITLLLYHDKDKERDLNFASFSSKNISWSGSFENQDIIDFSEKKFDLLISYYDFEKPALLMVTLGSKALFKTGFSSIDKRLNHLMIDTTVANSAVFVNELFKYLRILNKI